MIGSESDHWYKIGVYALLWESENGRYNAKPCKAPSFKTNLTAFLVQYLYMFGYSFTVFVP